MASSLLLRTSANSVISGYLSNGSVVKQSVGKRKFCLEKGILSVTVGIKTKNYDLKKYGIKDYYNIVINGNDLLIKDNKGNEQKIILPN